MKICFLSEYFPKSESLEIRGGVEVAAFNEALYLSFKHDITVLTSFEEDMKRESHIGNIKVIACGKKRSYVQSGSIKDRLNFMKAAYSEAVKSDFDLVVGYNFITYLVAWKVSKKLKIPCSLRYHDVWIGHWKENIGYLGYFGEILERYILSRDIDKIITVSDYTAKNLEKFFPKEKIETVHNIVEFDNEFEAPKFENKTVTCVSRLVEYKKIDDLILAISQLHHDYPDLMCKIIGTGPMEDKLKDLVKEHDLENNIEFLGFVEKHEDVLKTIKSSYLFCLPSKVEGFGIVIIEALGCEVPFIASNIDPVIEASGKKGGLFFEVEDYKDLSSKIKLLLDDEELYGKLKGECLEQYSKYQGEFIASKLEKIYLDLV